MKINAHAALKPKDSLANYSYEHAALAPHDIEVKITHCGICHSDIHLIDNDWGVSQYPLVPGHEIVGLVSARGDQVLHLEIGDRVGIGWQRSACLECPTCIAGDENYCTARQATCVANHGGFAESIRTDSRFVFRIPQKLSSENAAPLLCGGITVFTPLKLFNVRPEHKVGVIGIGGLGHLALQFVSAFGCEVTAFSSTPDKATEAKKFGAHHFIASTDSSALKNAAGTLDFIISTVFSDLDWNTYLRTLHLDGTLCFVGVPESPLQLPVDLLMSARRRVTSTSIGNRTDIQTMLEFAARHGITAQTETMPLSEVNAAIAKVRKNQARYRMVLTMS